MANDTNKQEKPETDIPTTPKKETSPQPQKEIGGRKGPEPTRYGDWEKNGIISDF